MKRRIIYTGILALLVGMAGQAQASRLGIHGAYSTGGNVEEPEIGFGGQLEFPINPILSVELAVTKFSDEIEGADYTIDQDLTSIGLSAVFRGPLGPQLDGYMLFGADYNTIDTDISFTNPTVSSAMNSNMELDDEVGFHIGAGLNLAITYNMELFTEYRYTFLETDNETAQPGSEEEYQYDFGLAKLGLNFFF
jgi:opacity protein-like surface antigen